MKKILFIASLLSLTLGSEVAFSKHTELYEGEMKEADLYIEYTDEIVEPNSDTYMLSVEEDEILESPVENIPVSSIEKVENYILLKDDEYEVLADNIKYIDEEYIIADKFFYLGDDINDSLEPFNRRMYAFNTEVDRHVFVPVATAYKMFVPQPVRVGINNFFVNLGEITTTINSILQLKPLKALNSLGRFAINSTVGIGGIFDVAKHTGMTNDPETFGETLGVYGFDTGSYLVVPIAGPTTVRDGVGMVVDGYMSGEVQSLIFDSTIYEIGVEADVFFPVKVTAQGLNARAMVQFKYGDMNSPFEYDLARAFIYNYRRLQVTK